jgi:RNA polymerase sigma-70 factor (ECF subfamily)
VTEPSELVPDAVLRRAAEGDRAAQQAVLAGVYDFVRRTLYRLLLGRAQDLDDLQQAALLKVLTSLPGFRREAAFKTWVTGICINVVRDHLRRKKREPYFDPFAGAAELRAARDGRGEERVEARRALGECVRALEGLPVNQRTVFVLKAVYGHSIEEIAELMDSAHSTTRLRLYYARRAMRKALGTEPELPARLLRPQGGK